MIVVVSPCSPPVIPMDKESIEKLRVCGAEVVFLLYFLNYFLQFIDIFKF